MTRSLGAEVEIDFDQRPAVVEKDGKPERVFPDELGAAVVVQAMLVAPERRRKVKIPPGTSKKPRLGQKRQSRITAALYEGDPKFAFRPDKSDHLDIGVRFDRENAASSLAGRGLDSRPKLATARRRKTTIPLSGQPAREPTHRLVNLNSPFETVAVALIQTPSEFKLETLTTGGGGLGLAESRERYQKLLAEREVIAETAKSEAEAEMGAEADLQPEIPWI